MQFASNQEPGKGDRVDTCQSEAVLPMSIELASCVDAILHVGMTVMSINQSVWAGNAEMLGQLAVMEEILLVRSEVIW